MPKLRDRIFASCPNCIYCGGINPAVEIDHLPSRVIFDDRHRPKGMEFASCEACNDSTRKSELVVGFLSRAYGSKSGRRRIKEFERLAREAERNNPGLLAEMQVDQLSTLSKLGKRATALPSWDFVNVGGPICRRAFQAFGFRLGVALHYHVTGVIVPKGGGVVVQYISNTAAFLDNLPETFIQALGPTQTLVQGDWHVSDQFRYASGMCDDFTLSGHLAVFRESFALMLMVATDVSEFRNAPIGSVVPV